ncbi:MAG TPA: SNF2-related protein, partial [Candidatus Deferrimicrobium sp.]|nr:SNF2-related protein [Candidatus Deferrimicrobium sp.]
MTFKEKLFQFYDKIIGPRGDGKEEYQKMIRYGALGELEENYFLYIYRDIYRNSAYYGAILFLNKPDELGNPICIHCFEQDGVEQTRNIYIRAALFFLKNEHRNTMEVGVSGKITEVFNRAKEKINEYIEHIPTPKGILEKFNFDVSNQEVKFNEIQLQEFTRQFENRTLKEQLAKLKETPGAVSTEPDNLEKPKARLGLNLKIDSGNLEEGKKILFQPLVLLLKQSGQYGNPKRILPTEVSKYDFIDTSPLLKQFLDHFASLGHHSFSDAVKMKILNQLYFPRLLEEIFSLPGESRFCQVDSFKKAYSPLKTIKFNSVSIRFAPSLVKDTTFKIRLKLTAAVPVGPEDGEAAVTEVDTGDDYIVQVRNEPETGPQICLFFTSPEDEHYLAIPGETPAVHFYGIFKFLETAQEFFLHDFGDILAAMEAAASGYLKIEPQLLKKYVLKLRPAPVLRIYPPDRERDNDEHLEVDFDYRREIKKFLAKHPDKEVITYDRDTEYENKCLQLLKADPLLKQEMAYDLQEKSVCYYYYFKEGDYLNWVMARGKFYLEKGFRVYMTEWKRFIGTTGSHIRVSLNADIDWLEFKPMVHDDLTDKSFRIDAIDLEKNAVTDNKGKLHLLTKGEIDKLIFIQLYGERHGDAFRVPSRNHILIRALYDKRMEEMPELGEVLKSAKKLDEFREIADYPLSKEFKGQLRGYQKEGFKWLHFLRDYGFSGCLADDMGLGKTVQTLALLQTLQDKNVLKTSLLVAPVSALPNWEMEIEKFTPGLRFYRHMGSKREKDTVEWHKVDLVITSYATLRNDIDVFNRFEFDHIILDESQNIKNHSSQVSRAIKILKGNRRLALSGTPIENNTMELWSLFDFLMPGYLGTPHWFTQQFASAIERDKDSQRVDLLKKMIYPFILRRKKGEVEAELPEKTEIVSKLRMEDEQLKLYMETAKYYREELEKEMDEKGVSKSSI